MMLSEWHTPESPNDGIMTCPLHPIKASVSHFVEWWRISAHAKQVQFGIFTIPVRIESEIKDGDRAIIESSSNYYFAARYLSEWHAEFKSLVISSWFLRDQNFYRWSWFINCVDLQIIFYSYTKICRIMYY